MILLWGALVTEAPACAGRATFQELSRALVEGEQAFRDSDRAALEAAEARAEALLLCLGEPLASAEVAGFMRLRGFAEFVRKDRTSATRWLESARAIDPAFALPMALIPKPHPLRTLFENVRVPPVDAVHLPPPARGWLEVDGRRASNVPANHPWVLQWRGTDGEVLGTVLGDGAPETLPYPVRAPEERVGVVATAGMQVDLRGEPGATRAGIVPVVLVPAPGPLSLELGLQLLFTGVDLGEETQLRLVPGVSAGVRAWLSPGEVRPFVGASAVGVGHSQGVAFGGVGALGLRVGRERFVEIDLRGQLTDGLVVQGGVGWGWALR